MFVYHNVGSFSPGSITTSDRSCEPGRHSTETMANRGIVVEFVVDANWNFACLPGCFCNDFWTAICTDIWTAQGN